MREVNLLIQTVPIISKHEKKKTNKIAAIQSSFALLSHLNIENVHKKYNTSDLGSLKTCNM